MHSNRCHLHRLQNYTFRNWLGFKFYILYFLAYFRRKMLIQIVSMEHVKIFWKNRVLCNLEYILFKIIKTLANYPLCDNLRLGQNLKSARTSASVLLLSLYLFSSSFCSREEQALAHRRCRCLQLFCTDSCKILSFF